MFKWLIIVLAIFVMPAWPAQAQSSGAPIQIASSAIAAFDLREMPAGGSGYNASAPGQSLSPVAHSAGSTAASTLSVGRAKAPEADRLTPPSNMVANSLKTTTAPVRQCPNAECSIKISADFVVQRAETLLRQGEVSRAQPWLDMLSKAPDHFLEYHFLSGFTAMQQQDYARAEQHFRSILDKDPTQTRVRLDLAVALYKQDKTSAADYQFRLVEQSDELPDSLKSTVRTARSAIRDQRRWFLRFDVGIAPDTNINNATDAEDVNVHLGPYDLDLRLNEDARAKSGIGLTAGFNGGYRVKTGKKSALLFEADGYLLEYDGRPFDDYSLQMAAGPEFIVGQRTRMSAQAVGRQRWFGGRSYQHDYGARADVQHYLDKGSAVAFRLEARRQDNVVNDGLDGWTYAATLSHERGIAKNFTLSASILGQRGDLDSPVQSYGSLGGVVGVGGELPYGFNIGASASYFSTRYDEPNYFFGQEKRQDDRYGGRLVLGNRAVEWLGFSPSVEYSYSRSDSNYALYESRRHRVQFKLARYF